MTPPRGRARTDRTETGTVHHDQQPDVPLHDALGVAVGGFAPHSRDLVHRAAARGRRLRRLRRAQLGLAAAVLIGASGFGLSTLGPAAGPAPVPPAASSAAPPSPSAVPTPSSSTSPPIVPPTILAPSYRPGGTDRTGPVDHQLAAMLPPRGSISGGLRAGQFTEGRLTLPDGGAAAPSARPPGTDREVTGSLLFDDGHGPVTVAVTLIDLTPQEVTGPRCENGQYVSCAIRPDGTRVTTGREKDPGRETRWSVTAVRPDGRGVRVVQFNYTDLSRTAMAISFDEMTAIALDPHWAK
ncbi:hypothetical protein [Kitasatospora sp. NPDC004289]